MISRASRLTSLVVLAALVPACLAGERPPHPLYPNPEEPRTPDELALLHGAFSNIDGRDVSRLGKTFSLLPGCHLARLADVGEMSSTAGYVANVSEVVFALRMRAGHSYAIDLQTQQLTGSTGQVTIQAIERDATGAEVSRLAPVTSIAQVTECRQWKP